MSGPFGSSQWMYASGGFYNGVATQSARFNDNDSPFLSFDPASSTAGTWTLSVWVKRANLGASSVIFSSGVVDARGHIFFNSTDELQVQAFNSPGQAGYTITDMKFRDPSAWYHIVVSANGITTANIATNLTIYVNGVEATRTTNIGSSATGGDRLNDAQAKRIGEFCPDSGSHFDGYMCDFNWVDGTALDQNDFGEFKNGVWIAKEPDVSNYGSAGFRLQFNQTGTGTGSSSTIGADTSGNDNHWTTSNVSAEDSNISDCPENNFATINPLARSRFDNTGTISEGNLKYNALSADRGFGFSSMGVASGKWYWELRVTATGRFQIGVGYESVLAFNGTYFGNNPSKAFAILDFNGNLYYDGTNTAYGSSLSVGDIVMVALDMDNYLCWFGKNGTWFDSATQSEIENSTATNDATTQMGTQQNLNNGDEVFPFMTCQETAQTGGGVFNFGQDSTFAGGTTAGGNADANGKGDFKYSVPSGYLALCTANLPEPTISPNKDTQADDYFNTVLYTGNGSTGHAITGVGFQPDWTWIKGRNYAGYNYLVDSVRGYTERLFSNLSDGASVEANTVTSSDSDGFTLGSDAGVNNNTSTYVAWNWKAGGTAVSNTDGSITSSVSANTDAGFSIVSFTGNGSNDATIGHGLGTTPAMIITKNRDDSVSWRVWHQDLTSTYVLLLDSTVAETAPSGQSNGYIKTVGSSTYSVYQGNVDTNGVNGSGDDMIAYCFAEIEGYSKFGSFSGNSNADGTFVYTGFRPAWVMVKYYTGTGANHWWIWDSARNTFNVVDEALVANLSVATQSPLDVDFTSNGFKFRTSNSEMNGSSASYIYMAFAEQPFKYANAR